MTCFPKSFTQQEPLPPESIDRACEILQSGRLHRYNTAEGEISETALLEQEYAAWQGAAYCLCVTSGGQAMQIALRALEVGPGEKILTNAYTLAPVPGAIHAVGAQPVLVEINDNWCIDTDHLCQQAAKSGAKFLLLSHMRGHIADMERIMDICAEYGLTLIEDCAHTMGASWSGKKSGQRKKSGNFGKIACFSTQTYKHLNAGEGGFITTEDPELAARSIILSGSYMMYERHGAAPPPDQFKRVRLQVPNCSARLDNLRSAILRPQLKYLDENIQRWNERYRVLEAGLRTISGVRLIDRPVSEEFVGSSIQFHLEAFAPSRIPEFLKACAGRGIDLKWFGASDPTGFTSRYDSWQYLEDIPHLPQTQKILSTTCDMRVPLTFTPEDCQHITTIIDEVVAAFKQS